MFYLIIHVCHHVTLIPNLSLYCAQSLAVNEPIGVLREGDHDCFAIGNARAEKFILKSGRIRGSAPLPKKDSINLRDDAYTDQTSNFRPSVAQVSPRSKGFFDVASHGMSNPNEEEEWAPSGQPRRPPEGLQRTEGMKAMDHMGRPIHIPQLRSPQQQAPSNMIPPNMMNMQPSPQQLQQSSRLSPPRKPIEPAPWGVNYEERNNTNNQPSHSSASHQMVTPFDVEGAFVPTNIHFHTLNTTQAHPPPQHIPGQPSLPDQNQRPVPSRVRDPTLGSPRGYVKVGPGFGHVPSANGHMSQQSPYSYQQEPQRGQQQYEAQQRQIYEQQQQYEAQQRQQYEQQQQYEAQQRQQQQQQLQEAQQRQQYEREEELVDFSNLTHEDNGVVSDFVEWYQSAYNELPPAAMVSRAVLDARSKRPPPPSNMTYQASAPAPITSDGFNHKPRLSPLQSPKSSRSAHSSQFDGESPYPPADKKMGGRSFAMGSGGGAPTMNQNNSILGRRSTRVAAPPGGVSSFSIGGY
jgi:hypothetical protein